MAYFEDFLHFLPILFGTLLVAATKYTKKKHIIGFYVTYRK